MVEDRATSDADAGASTAPGLPTRPPIDPRLRAVAKAQAAAALFAASEPVMLGRYQLLELVGRGGMGVIWGAWDPELARRVAIKLVETGASARERMLREGQALAQLSHPNVVPVYDVGVVDGDQVFLVMEWVRGETLRAWSRTARRVREIVEVYRAAGAGLAAVHAAGLVHRDVKPDNVIVGTDGRVRVLDFGLAHAGPPAEVAGTPRYMAPEQADGGTVTAAADQFAFGVSLRETLAQHAALPAWLAAIIARATAPDPAARFPDMPALLAALAHDPRRVWGRRIAAVGVVALAGAAFAAGTSRATSPPACSDDGAIATVWNPRLRIALATQLRGLGAFGAATATQLGLDLDRYAAGWIGARHAACLAHQDGALATAHFEQTSGCLARARAALAAVTEVVLRADREGLPAALVAARSLPDAARCQLESEASTVAPPPAGLAPAVAEAAAAVERARIRAIALEPDAIAAAAQAAAAARALGHAPLQGRAELVHGLALLLQNARAEALPVLEHAQVAAFGAGDPRTGVEAFARAAFARGTTLDAAAPQAAEIAAMRGATALAEPLARGLGATGAFARALLLNNLGTWCLALGDRACARARFAAALRERPPLTGETIELAGTAGNAAMVEPDPARRRALFARERADLIEVVGADHPLTLEAEVRAAVLADDADEARAALRDACARYARLHPHLTGAIAHGAYELLWLAVDAGNDAEAQDALAALGSGSVLFEHWLAPLFQQLLAGDLAAVASHAPAVARELQARDAPWARWRSVDALLVAALAEQRRGAHAAAAARAEEALAVAASVPQFASTAFYRRRLARLHALRDSR